MNDADYYRNLETTEGLFYPELLRWWAQAIEDGVEIQRQWFSQREDSNWETLPAVFPPPPFENAPAIFRRSRPAWHSWPIGKPCMVRDKEGAYSYLWRPALFLGIGDVGCARAAWHFDDWDEVREPTDNEMREHFGKGTKDV